jgi:5'-methylthioadenosine phosphorylase
VISISAVGSMRPEIKPGHVVMIDQLFDRTRGHRAATFFGDGIVGHIQFADPMCAALSRVVGDAAREAGATVHDSGTYLCIDGPQFSTRAESRIYRSWGVDVIGMTAIPEAKLAREAGLCYATVAMSTDYDCWHEEEEDVSVGGIIETLRRNVSLARQIVRTAALRIPEPELRRCACPSAARQAVITDRAVWPAETRRRLALILGASCALDEPGGGGCGGGEGQTGARAPRGTGASSAPEDA